MKFLFIFFLIVPIVEIYFLITVGTVIGAGMTVLSPGHGATDDEVAAVERIFAAVGRCRVLDEQYLDAVTALSGSGPAFACVIIEALADGGVMMGLPGDSCWRRARILPLSKTASRPRLGVRLLDC